VGRFSANQFSLGLTPIPLTITVNTVAGAEVLLNGQSIGSANGQGVLSKSEVLPGTYDVEVRLAGYDPFHYKDHLSPPRAPVYAQLHISQARIKQMEDERSQAQEKQQRIQLLIRTAQQQFNSRQYQAALASVDEALKLEPGNAGAQQFRNRVVQTINILK
jgi:hypothetical protein